MSAYDGAITVFSPDGHLYQVQYATEAVKRGGSAVCVTSPDAIVFAVGKRASARLRDDQTARKVFVIDDHCALAFSGLQADARVLIDKARVEACSYRLRYAEPAPVSAVARYVAQVQQRYTQSGGVRPFGLGTLIAGWDNGEPRLYVTDPTGVYTEWIASAVGRESKNVLEHLETRCSDIKDEEGAIKVAIGALQVAAEAASRIEVFVMRRGQPLTQLTSDEVDAYMTAH